MSLRSQFAQTIHDLSHSDPELVVVVGDISHGIFKPFAADYQDRYYNIGICEPATVSLAAGLNKVGLNPVVHTIAPFLIERSFEQIKLNFSYQKLSGNLVSVGGTFDYSQLGCSHHCYADVALIKQLPKSKIFTPGSAEEFDYLFRKHYQTDGIKYFRLTENPHQIPVEVKDRENIGVKVIEGTDITIVTTGAQLKNCYQACKILSSNGIHPELIYLPQIWPYEPILINESIEKTKNLFIVSELHDGGGLFDQCLRASTHLQKKTSTSLEISDFIRDFGTYDQLCQEVGLTVANIVKRVEGFCR